jgi:hypothetical protein
MFSMVAYAQPLVIAADSSYILFPDNAKIMLTKAGGGETAFQLAPRDFQALVITTNYLLNRMTISESNLELLLKNENISGATAKVMEERFHVERERTGYYKTAFEDLKLISSRYDSELRQCANDLQVMKNQKDSAKKKSFAKGILWGLAIRCN